MTAPPALAGKVAIVTGGSRGLGRSIAIALATAGADVAVAARSKADLEETAGLVVSTALAGLDSVNALVVDPATQLIDVVVETVAGTTVSIKDPSGKTLATATVDDGGVLDLQALPDGAGAYALVIHDGTAGTIAFQAWEVLTESR